MYTPLESFYTEGQGDGLGPATEMAVDHLLFKFNEKNYFVWSKELCKSLFQKVQLWCCVCSNRLKRLSMLTTGTMPAFRWWAHF